LLITTIYITLTIYAMLIFKHRMKSKAMSRRTETAYKAQPLGESAFMHCGYNMTKPRGSRGRVNAAVASPSGAIKYSWGVVKDHALIRGDLSDVRLLF